MILKQFPISYKWNSFSLEGFGTWPFYFILFFKKSDSMVVRTYNRNGPFRQILYEKCWYPILELRPISSTYFVLGSYNNYKKSQWNINSWVTKLRNTIIVFRNLVTQLLIFCWLFFFSFQENKTLLLNQTHLLTVCKCCFQVERGSVLYFNIYIVN